MRSRPAVVPLIASTVALLGLLARVAVAQPETACAGDPNLPGVARVNAELAAQLDAASAVHDAPANDGGASRPRYTNRLVLESSPYLLQHAHNPVNWYAWGDEAFERAKCEGKPVLLSIGYSTCHWCHVMERESFENEEIARFLNEHFVAVKVDREERPDIDNVYMAAVQLLTGGGGWPMTLALTPERQPFFAATYIPPRDGDRGAQKGFLTVLGELADAYRTNPAGAVEVAAEISRRIAAQVRNRPAAGVPDGEAIAGAVASLTRAFDPTHGGFGIAPKFPQPSLHELLLHFFRRTNDRQALAMVTRSLEQMAAGGIHDHVGGGFHRYSTDAGWQVPHFEKMLYDNAQLASLYLDAYQVTARPDFAQVARGTLDYLAREMTSPEGGFYGASDADSRTPAGTIEEGWYYTWTPAQTEEVLGTEAGRVANTYFGITDAGNFHARSVLHTSASVDELARSLGTDPRQLRAQIETARRQLYAARLRRPPPFRDDKIVASWNGLAISAFARSGFVLDSPDDTRRAGAAADFVLARMRAADGTLLHSFRGGRAHGTATLDDYAFVVQGLLDLFETTWQLRWLRSALDLQSALDARYFDEEEGAYFLTPHTGEVLLARPKPSMDGAEPAGNSVAAMNLLRLSALTSDEAPRRRAEALFRAFGATLRAGSPALPRMLCALDFYLDEPPEVVIVRAPGDTETLASLLARARAVYLPNRAFTVTDTSDAPQEQHALVPLTIGKHAISGRTTAYVCRKQVCERPTSDADRFAHQLRAVEPLLVGDAQPEAPHSNTNKHEQVSH